MKAPTVAAALASCLCLAFLCCQPLSAAKRIELWKPTPPKPVDEPVDEAGEEVQEADEETPEETRPAKILQHAARQSGLELIGELITHSAESLQPKGDEAEGESAAAPPLPDYIGQEPFDDYGLVALAAGEFKHPRGQTLRATLFESDNAADAWGLWSVGRGEKTVALGQAASWGTELRIWKGQFTAVLSLDPPDERLDESRLTKFGRLLAAGIPGRGVEPEMASWLPATNQVPASTTYFHTKAPVMADMLNLSAETEGVAAAYQFAGKQYHILIVRYPDREAALTGWGTFAAQVLGSDLSTGTEGGRRIALKEGTWSTTRTKGRVAVFVVGVPLRESAAYQLVRALAKAHD